MKLEVLVLVLQQTLKSKEKGRKFQEALDPILRNAVGNQVQLLMGVVIELQEEEVKKKKSLKEGKKRRMKKVELLSEMRSLMKREMEMRRRKKKQVVEIDLIDIELNLGVRKEKPGVELLGKVEKRKLYALSKGDSVMVRNGFEDTLMRLLFLFTVIDW